VKCSINFINLIIEDRDDGEWRLTCYYGDPECSCRCDAYDLLRNRELRDMSTLPYCVVGNFNDLFSQHDKFGIHPHPNWLCIGFREAVEKCDLLYKLDGHPFMWIKSAGTNKVVKKVVDTFMASKSYSRKPSKYSLRL